MGSGSRPIQWFAIVLLSVGISHQLELNSDLSHIYKFALHLDVVVMTLKEDNKQGNHPVPHAIYFPLYFSKYIGACLSEFTTENL